MQGSPVNPTKPNMQMTHWNAGRAFSACLFAVTMTTAHADTIVQTVGNIDWNAAMWGTPAAAPTAGNDYVSATGVQDERFRISADGLSSTFGGDSLTVVPGTRALMKNQSGATATINGDFILDGGRLSFGPNGGPHTGTLDVVNFVVGGTGSFIDPSSSVSALTIDGILTGSGDLLITPENGTNTKTVTFTEVGDYTGNLTVSSTILLDFNVDHEFTGSLTLDGSAILYVDQTLTFQAGNLVADGIVIPPGTYSGASIFDLGLNFDDGGGTLIVEGSFPDADNDGLPDFYEDQIIAFDDTDDVDGYEDIAGPNDAPATTDFDGDGRTDTEEYADGVAENQTDPTDPDVDDDGLLDGSEFAGTDNNGTPTGFGATDPFDADSDDDGFTDGIEVRYGFNPNDDTALPGDAAPIVNGGFETPALPVFGEGISVDDESVPGWETTVNDFYVLDFFAATDVNNPDSASEGFQFATAVRGAPEPDVDPSAYVGGADATMGMRQDVDVSALATQIDEGARTFLLDFDWRENDTADMGVVTISFLDGSGTELGRPSVFETSGGLQAWTSTRQAAFPPVGTRTVRITAEAIKIGTGTSTVRNVHFDDFKGRLVDFDADNDELPDPWELLYGLDPDDAGDASISSDGDSLTNLEEFEFGTDPSLADTDGDGINDDVEIDNETDPLDPASPAQDVEVVDIITTTNASGQVTQVEVVFSGLNVNTTYSLMRGTDLITFPDAVDSGLPESATDSYFDLTPLPSETSGKAFYRLEDQ